MLQSVALQRVGQAWVTAQQHTAPRATISENSSDHAHHPPSPPSLLNVGFAQNICVNMTLKLACVHILSTSLALPLSGQLLALSTPATQKTSQLWHALLPKPLCTLCLHAPLTSSPFPCLSDLNSGIKSKQYLLEFFHRIESSSSMISKHYIPLLCHMSQNCNCTLISMTTNICFFHLKSKDLLLLNPGLYENWCCWRFCCCAMHP